MLSFVFHIYDNCTDYSSLDENAVSILEIILTGMKKFKCKLHFSQFSFVLRFFQDCCKNVANKDNKNLEQI